jgi:folate-dependent phosphoribosylglycinamide formyltransferase PurN
MKTKIVLLARACDSTSIVYNYLSQHFELKAVIIEKAHTKKKHLLNRIKRLGFWYAMGQAAFMIFVNPQLKLFSKKRKKEIVEKFKLDLNPIPAHLFREVKSLNTESSRQLLKELDADLIIVNGTRIISKKTLECISAPFINIHVGITPLFRGVHGGYWAIAVGRKELFGVTIDYVDPGVDTGGIIEQIFLTPEKKDNFYTYPYLKYAATLPVLKKVIEDFVSGNKPQTKLPVTNESSLWYHPTLFQYLRNIKRTFTIIFITVLSAFNSILF